LAKLLIRWCRFEAWIADEIHGFGVTVPIGVVAVGAGVRVAVGEGIAAVELH
jgi:hypothetical protein